MVAVEIGLLAWLSPSLSGLPPRPPPKKQNITQRAPSALCPDKDSALMVPKGAAVARAGSACASAPRTTPISRRMVSV